MIKLLSQTIIIQAFGYLLQFLAFLIFARILGTEDLGILTIFRTLGQVIASIMWVGLPAGMVYFIGKDRLSFFFLLKNCLKWFVLGFPLIVLFLYLAPINSILKFNPPKIYIAYFLIFIFLLSFFNLFQSLILSLKKYLYYNLFAFGLGILIFCFSVVMGLFPHNRNKLTFAIISYLIGYSIMFFYGLVLVSSECYRLKGKPRKRVSFLEQFNVGFRGFISSISGLLLYRLDLFLVGFFLSLRDVGVYSIALFGAEMITKIPNWSSSILKPMVASNEQGHIRRTVYLFYSLIITSLLLGLFFVLIFAIFPHFISNLIGKDFAGVEVCLLLLLPRVIMQSGVAALGANLAGKGYPLYHPVGMISALLCLILLDIILIPRLGINGAALANSLAFVACFIIYCVGYQIYNKDSIFAGLKPFLSYIIHKF
ncbi:MAG: lipopolysaccharide biosynthesis protein [Planctomycetota bacterium]|jgi:O-antigen/teichoic acid export membrane protein